MTVTDDHGPQHRPAGITTAAQPARLILLRSGPPPIADREQQTDLLQRLGIVADAALHNDVWMLRYAGSAFSLSAIDSSSALVRQALAAPLHLIDHRPLVLADSATLSGLQLESLNLPPAPGRAAMAQHLCAVASLLVPAFGLTHMFWHPADLWSDAAALGAATIAMESSGLPPVLHLVAFDVPHMAHRAHDRLVSHGLSWFCGCELQLDGPVTLSTGDYVRRAARLAIDVMVHGNPGGPRIVPGLDPTERLKIDAIQSTATGDILPVTIIPSALA